MTRGHRWVKAAELLGRTLLWLYPGSFRREMGQAMIADLRRRAGAVVDHRSRISSLTWLARAAGSLLWNAAGAWRDTVAFGPRGDGRRIGREVGWAARSLRRSPVFMTVSGFTVALGIGATTAIFTLLDGILLEPLPYPDPGRVVVVKHAVPALDLVDAGLSGGTYLWYRARAQSFEGIGAYLENVVSLSGAATPERVQVALVSSEVFHVLGARAELGRLFTPDEQAPFDPEIVTPVVLSHDLWVRQYGRDPAVVGRIVELNAAPKRVVGVMEAGFRFPRAGTEIWYPLGLDPSSAEVGGLHYGGIGKLKEGVTPLEAERELRRLVPGLATAYPDASPELLAGGGLTPVVHPLRDELIGEARPVLWILMGSAALVLLVACANVLNLLFVRSEQRRREMALRLAVGAGRGDLGRLVLAEGILLAGVGLAGGLALAWLGVRTLLAFGPDSLPRLEGVGLGARGVVFALTVAAICALAFGGALLLRNGRAEIASMLGGGKGRGAETVSHPAGRSRWVLVGGQVAVALTLLVGAALMVRSGARLARVDAGVDAEDVLTLEIALPFSPYPVRAARVRFWHDVLEGIRALPGVKAAGAVTTLPLTPVPSFYRQVLAVEDEVPRGDATSEISTRFFTAGYLDALGIPLLEGRRVAPGEAGDGDPVLVSAALAKRLFPGGSAVGRRIRPAGNAEERWSTVAGVVGDVRQEGLTADPAEVVYIPILERPVFLDVAPSALSVAVRTAVPPHTLTPAVRRVVLAVDPAMPISNVRTMERILAASTARARFTMKLLLMASGVALFLGVVGIWGVVSYTVGRRTREIAVRLALGARPSRVTRMVVGEVALVITAGVLVGILAASWLTRFLRSLLFEVSPTDPVVFLTVAALLTSVGVLASWLPVRRATRVDLVATLKEP